MEALSEPQAAVLDALAAGWKFRVNVRAGVMLLTDGRRALKAHKARGA